MPMVNTGNEHCESLVTNLTGGEVAEASEKLNRSEGVEIAPEERHWASPVVFNSPKTEDQVGLERVPMPEAETPFRGN